MDRTRRFYSEHGFGKLWRGRKSDKTQNTVVEFGEYVWVRVLTRVKIGTRNTRQLNPEDHLLITEEKLVFKDGDKV